MINSSNKSSIIIWSSVITIFNVQIHEQPHLIEFGAQINHDIFYHVICHWIMMINVFYLDCSIEYGLFFKDDTWLMQIYFTNVSMIFHPA